MVKKKKAKKAQEKPARKKATGAKKTAEPKSGGDAQKGLKSLIDKVSPDSMGAFSSLYLDPVEGGFKVTIWSGKSGIIEGFVPEGRMPPFVREVLVKRTESLAPGESIELIGKRENDIALIAAEPIENPEVSGTLIADVSTKNGEIHLKITLQRELVPLAPEDVKGEPEIDLEHLANAFNKDIKENMGIPEYEAKASELVGELWETERLVKNPRDKKTIASVCKAAESLSELSKKYGFTKISQLSESMAILFEAYHHKGAANPSSLPIVMQTVGMLEKMVEELSHGPDVDYLVSKISRKDSAS